MQSLRTLQRRICSQPLTCVSTNVINVKSINNTTLLSAVNTTLAAVFEYRNQRYLSTTTKASTELIKKLRQQTGAPISDCKDAIIAATAEGAEFDLQKALDYLRKKGIATAAKRSEKAASEGLIGIAVQNDTVAMVEINSETDFVSRNDLFQNLVVRVANTTAQLSAANNNSSNNGMVPLDTLLNSKTQTETGNTCNVSDLVADAVAAIKENIQIRRAFRLQYPNGIIGAYMHSALPSVNNVKLGRIGAIVVLASSTTDNSVQASLSDLAYKIAMHIVAAQPRFLTRESVPKEVLDHERNIIMEQIKESSNNNSSSNKDKSKSEAIIQKTIEGRLNKFYEENVLLEQTYLISDMSSNDASKPATPAKPLKINQVLSKNAAAGIQIVHFERFQVGAK